MKDSYRKILTKHKKKLLSLNHVLGVGLGKKIKKGKTTDEDSIIVLVDKKIPEESLQSKDIVPKQLDTLKTDVQEVGVLKLLKIPRNKKYRPAPGGVSVGHYKVSAGTLGAIVRDKKTGEPFILSNNHVLANLTNGHDGRAKIGDPILQPGSYDKGNEEDDVIGNLVRFIPLNPVTDNLNSPTNIVDCALARPVEENIVDKNILGIGKAKGIREPELGMRVMKSGRTTGVTRGNIRAIDSTLTVELDENKKGIFSDQVIMSPLSEAGDSGSLIMDEDRNVVGLLFAGSDKVSVCNKITNVMDELKIDFFLDEKNGDNPGDKDDDNGQGPGGYSPENFDIYTIILMLVILLALNIW